MILAISDLQETVMLPTKFQVNWPFDSGEEAKIDFQDGCHDGHLVFLSNFLSTSHLILPTNFQVNWPFGSREAKNRFSRWLPSWNSNWYNFSYF